MSKKLIRRCILYLILNEVAELYLNKKIDMMLVRII